MPIPLSSLPEHIKNAIVQKIEYRDFVNFHQSSLDCFNLAKQVKTRFSMSPRILHGLDTNTKESTRIFMLYSNEVIGMQFVLYDSCRLRPNRSNFCEYPVRFENYDVIVFGNLTENYCLSLISIVECTNSTIKELILGEISCTPDTLNRLIEAAKVKKLPFTAPISPDYMRMERIRKISEFYITTFMNEADILALNAVDLTVLFSDMTSEGFNRLLENLLADDETIEKQFTITTNDFLLINRILDGIPHEFAYSVQGVLFTIGEGRNRYKMNIIDQTVQIYKSRDVPVGFPFGGFPMLPFGGNPDFSFAMPLYPDH